MQVMRERKTEDTAGLGARVTVELPNHTFTLIVKKLQFSKPHLVSSDFT